MMDNLDMRIRSFIRNPSVSSVTGPRRMPRSVLMDHVMIIAKEEFPEHRQTRIDDGAVLSDICIPEGGKVAVFLVDPYLASDVGGMLRDRLSDSLILFSVQELCHQVPVCIKGLHGLIGCDLSGF